MLRNSYQHLLRKRHNRARRSSLHAVKFIRALLDRNCDLDDNDQLARALGTPQAASIIHNNGSHTFLTHSTTPEKAARILQEGLLVSGYMLQPAKPDLQSTVMMLAGPQTNDRLAINEFGILYRYAGNLRDQAARNSAKVIIELPIPYQDTIFADNPFAHTPLADADNKLLVRESLDGQGQYRIPAHYVKGYFDLVTGVFTPNPSFNNM